MSFVKILGETEDTVTISRDDWKRLQEQLEDAQDRAAVTERRAHERRIGSPGGRNSEAPSIVSRLADLARFDEASLANTADLAKETAGVILSSKSARWCR